MKTSVQGSAHRNTAVTGSGPGASHATIRSCETCCKFAALRPLPVTNSRSQSTSQRGIPIGALPGRVQKLHKRRQAWANGCFANRGTYLWTPHLKPLPPPAHDCIMHMSCDYSRRILRQNKFRAVVCDKRQAIAHPPSDAGQRSYSGSRGTTDSVPWPFRTAQPLQCPRAQAKKIPFRHPRGPHRHRPSYDWLQMCLEGWVSLTSRRAVRHRLRQVQVTTSSTVSQRARRRHTLSVKKTRRNPNGRLTIRNASCRARSE